MTITPHEMQIAELLGLLRECSQEVEFNHLSGHERIELSKECNSVIAKTAESYAAHAELVNGVVEKAKRWYITAPARYEIPDPEAVSEAESYRKALEVEECLIEALARLEEFEKASKP
jgi:hypothetical protein